MTMTFRARLLELLRVPPEPTAAPGDEDVHVFRAAPNYFRYRVLVWLMRQGAAAIGIIFGLVVFLGGVSERVPADAGGRFPVTQETMVVLFTLFEIVGVGLFVLQVIASGALLRLDFEQRWYLVSDRSLRIREGLIRLHEKTMTFANIQHVSIRQGPVQRWLGIADLEVRTAGGGANGAQERSGRADLHVGYVRGVANAESIRDVIRERLRRHGDAGLGDPDDRSGDVAGAHRRGVGQEGRGRVLGQEHQPVPARTLTAAAVMLRDEARAMRRSLGDAAGPGGSPSVE